MGHLTQGKTMAVDFQRKPAPPGEWISAYDAHEKIIPDELFRTVQSLRQIRQEIIARKPKAPYTPNIYKGRIYCAHCGSHMERRKNHSNYVFSCVSNRTVPNSCCGNRIREDAVKDMLSGQLIKFKDELSGVTVK